MTTNLLRIRSISAAVNASAVLAMWAVAASVLPSGLPVGVVLLGVVLGGLSSLAAMGLVLVYRASRIINFAQVEIGGIAASVSIVMVAGWELPYLVALPVGLGMALIAGWVIDAVVIRRLFTAPRLLLTVATIGVAQVLGGVQIALPGLFENLGPLNAFEAPLDMSFRLGPLVFHGDHVVAMMVVPLVLAGLAWFLYRSDIGVAIRAAADSSERALLLGIPVRRLSLITWLLAAALSGVASMLSTPILGRNLGVPAGPGLLLVPLTAAVIGRMERLPTTVVASMGIGVFIQGTFWNYPRSSVVDVGLFLVVLLALLFQRRRFTRVDDGDLGGFIAAREVRPLPAVLTDLPVVRRARLVGWLALAFIAVVVPMWMTTASQTLFAYTAIYGIIAVSLVVLTGWAGQISLGQFAFAGVGAATTASLLVHAGFDLFVALMASAVIGAMAAVLVGVPALRIQGPFLAVTTLAFGVPVSTFLLNAAYFPTLVPERFNRPALFDRIDLSTPLSFYYFCLAFLALTVWLATNYRHTRAGRTALAVRDNWRGAASFSIDPVRAKLTAFALAGALAGIAGGLFVLGLRGLPFSGFPPITSLVVFTMVVIGGVASIPGALLGAAYVQGVQYFLDGSWRLLATGGGLLVLLMAIPGGLGEVLYRLRDAALGLLARREGISLRGMREVSVSRADTEYVAASRRASPRADAAQPRQPLIACEAVDASYGQIQVLFGVDLAIDDREIVALLGTNGAGKSTVLRVISGLLSAGQGRVLFEGRDITDLSPIDRVAAGIVMVPGGRGVFGSLTVAENLRMAAWLHRKDRGFREETLERIFDLLPLLRDRLEAKASSLSGGEQQMLTIALALFCRPRILMIDELSLGLAPVVVGEMLDAVRQINADGTTVVIVEQSVNIATSLAGRAVFMEKGEVRFTGKTTELTKRPDLLRAVFLRSAPAVRSRSRSRSASRPARGGHPPPLEVRGIGRRFGGVVALDGVDMRLEDGQILGIIGSNGAGKTTLFDVCSGFLSSDSGEVLLDGKTVTALSSAERSGIGLGRAFQDARLFPSLTVVEAIAVALERHIDVREPIACVLRLGATVESERAVAARVDDLVETMGLADFRNAFISELSTGTRRIVELACAIAHQPRVLLLDEPSSGLAQRESEALAPVLVDIKERTGASLAIIEHDIPLVSSIADAMMCLHLGRVIASGSPRDVLAHPAVIGSYLGEDQVAISRSGRGRLPRANGHQRRRSVRTAGMPTAEYAARTGLSAAAVRAKIRRGDLAAVKGPRGYLVSGTTRT